MHSLKLLQHHIMTNNSIMSFWKIAKQQKCYAKLNGIRSKVTLTTNFSCINTTIAQKIIYVLTIRLV